MPEQLFGADARHHDATERRIPGYTAPDPDRFGPGWRDATRTYWGPNGRQKDYAAPAWKTVRKGKYSTQVKVWWSGQGRGWWKWRLGRGSSTHREFRTLASGREATFDGALSHCMVALDGWVDRFSPQREDSRRNEEKRQREADTLACAAVAHPKHVADCSCLCSCHGKIL